ncbi:Shwachman-bodian-diamond syndrome protein [Neofusicoccum parvum]|uniref:Ribosome maturation protein SDO1/SBDS N-terminal domain-containing protein n=3 Tax=Neofusicoccum TaxID=407951 RepID=A0ABR3SWB1_9PEZI|nr:putative rna binding protein [Neofusicoccum parvum UCRNP2]GME23326.1 Shwachman-bodian-diamond syndrome protein [Neofusicoccum parvum]GME36525.1 Shwachman-bodian-diamond syndrome protein [Neofusicoccum parvum]
MPKGADTQTKVHYKGKEDDFIIFVDSQKAVQDWKEDKSVPLAQVVNGWKVFVTHKHGTQGVLDTASNSALDNEFGTHKDEDVVKQILEKGDVQSVEEKGRQGDTNISGGATVSHGYGQ